MTTDVPLGKSEREYFRTYISPIYDNINLGLILSGAWFLMHPVGARPAKKASRGYRCTVRNSAITRDNLLGHARPHERDGLAGVIHQFVERGNHWSILSRRPDVENYANGHIQFAFEYSEDGANGITELTSRHLFLDEPDYLCAAKNGALSFNHERIRKIRHPFLNFAGRKFFVVCGWNEQLMLVNNIQFMNEVEWVVPSIFGMIGSKFDNSIVEVCPGTMGESLSRGFIKPICFLPKGKLGVFSFLVARAIGGDDLPVGMIDGGAQIVNDIAANQSGFIYDGFIEFGKEGALSCLCIGFDNVEERSLFAEKFVKFSDVFRCPINLRSALYAMAKPDDLKGTKNLMGALVRMKPKQHDDMKLGKAKAKKVKESREEARFFQAKTA